ncbi:MAG: M20 family metallopeptidase [Micrococcales bacterium]|nr:M20 family metallopeptidase [Micrococcales bacterium]
MRTLELAAALGPDLIALRRRLHQIPEIGLDLPQTQQAILAELAGLDLEVTLGRELSSVTAVLRGRGGDPDAVRPVVLLRGDMDALPVREEVAADFVSRHDGAMHACGHDLHMAALVGAARILHERRDELAGDIVFMFQPGEEGPGGAEIMVREGLLEVAGRRVDAAYSLHVYSSEHPGGTWFGKPGTLMAGCDELYVRVVGEGGHGSAPERTRDPIPVACEMVLALQTMVTRQFSVWDPVVVTVGKIAGGTKENIIPDDACFEATIRTFSDEHNTRIKERILQLLKGIAAAHGQQVEIDYRRGYPVTVNEEGEFERAREVLSDLFGDERWSQMSDPEAGSEDFSFVSREVPSAYLNLSACPAGVDPVGAPDNHSPRADFDDQWVPDGAAFLAEAALRRCASLADELA